MSWNNSIAQRTKTLEEKFWEKVDIRGENDCWEWKASHNRKGYGNFYVSVGKSKDRHCLAHRMSWTLTNGRIPDGFQVCHTCDNPSCVNPRHLWLGTNRDNAIDKVKKGRMQDYKGEKHPSNKLTEKEVLKIRELRKSGRTFASIGEEFGVHLSTIAYICNGKLWSYLEK